MSFILIRQNNEHVTITFPLKSHVLYQTEQIPQPQKRIKELQEKTSDLNIDRSLLRIRDKIASETCKSKTISKIYEVEVMHKRNQKIHISFMGLADFKDQFLILILSIKESSHV